MKVKEESEKVGLKVNIQKTKIMASGPITSQQIGRKQWKQWLTLFFWAPKSLQMVTAAIQEEKGTMEDEMVGWHHRRNGHEFEQALGDSEGQESLVCCSPWGHKESDTTERLNNKYNMWSFVTGYFQICR